MRVDKYIVEEGYFESRNRANEAIKAKKVKVDGKIAKASTKVDENSVIEVENEKFYASRAGRKLESFLDAFPMDMQNKRALDIGSSTGGFAQIILEQAVASLACVDVGSDQLHISLRQNPLVTVYEKTDIRDFQSPFAFEVISCDVSFISILQIIENINRLAQIGTIIVILYKPQFEVGKDVKRDSKGVVLDLDAIARRKEEFEAKTKSFHWQEKHQVLSALQGKEGNQEYLYAFVKEA